MGCVLKRQEPKSKCGRYCASSTKHLPSPTEAKETISPTDNCEFKYENQQCAEDIAGWKQTLFSLLCNLGI